MQRCPNCDREFESKGEHRPFCSARCKDVDLGKWLGEEYVISRPMLVDEVQRAFGEDEEGVR
jgi:endogenous inhibitor of DNA gyrase (YacG/DUF329 family)